MKPTKEEMLNWLMAVERDLFRTDEGWTKTDKRLCGAIRDLIKEIGDFRIWCKVINANGSCDGETQLFLDAFENWDLKAKNKHTKRLHKEIRDFGKEGK